MSGHNAMPEQDDDAMAVDSDDESMEVGNVPPINASPQGLMPTTGGVAGPNSDDAAAKRRAIQAIMGDSDLTDLERRLSIQALMDGTAQSQPHTAPYPHSVINPAAPQLVPPIPTTGPTSSHGLPDEAMICVHYEQKCNIFAPLCGRFFGCRVCHNKMTPPPRHGPMNRFAVWKVVCKEFQMRQPSL